jgi:hypothetical protein
MKRAILTGIILVIALVMTANHAGAQMTFDPQNYGALADVSSEETIPPGTQITVDSWRHYKKFLPIWMWAAYGGQYHWKIGGESYFTISPGKVQAGYREIRRPGAVGQIGYRRLDDQKLQRGNAISESGRAKQGYENPVQCLAHLPSSD